MTYTREARGGILRRLLEKTDQTSCPDGCWIWLGALSNRTYGHMHTDTLGKTEKAHRVSYRLHVGEIPNGLDLDHLCRRPMCVNPAHLEPVTRRENLRRSKAAIGGHHNSQKTHCVNGHPFALPGGPGVWRQCVQCSRARRGTSRRD